MSNNERRRPASGSGRSDVAIAFGVGLGVSITAAAAVAIFQLFKGGRKPTLTEQQWRDALDSESRVNGWPQLLEVIRQGGMEPRLRHQVWPFLLKAYDPGSGAEQRYELYNELCRSYRDLLHRCQELETSLESSVVRTGAGVAVVAGNANPAASLPAHLVQFAEAQRIIVLDAVRTQLPADHRASGGGGKSGVGPSGRGSGGGSGGATGGGSGGGDAGQLANGFGGDFHKWAAGGNGGGGSGGVGGGGGGAGPGHGWTSRVAQESLASAAHLTSAQREQASRLINLLSAYAVHDPETGYCQGMSDLAAPFLALLDDDALAFWCFAQLMQTARHNFRHDEAGIRGQLRSLLALLQVVDPVLSHRLRQVGAAECHFAYRMLVVMMRRELSLAQCMSLWEILWADAMATTMAAEQQQMEQQHAKAGDQGAASPSQDDTEPEPGLLLFVAAAVVRSQRRAILDEAQCVDDLLKLFAGIRVDVWSTLRVARTLQRTYRQAAAAASEEASQQQQQQQAPQQPQQQNMNGGQR